MSCTFRFHLNCVCLYKEYFKCIHVKIRFTVALVCIHSHNIAVGNISSVEYGQVNGSAQLNATRKTIPRRKRMGSPYHTGVLNFT